MAKQKDVKNKIQDMLSALFITIVFIAVISVIFIKLASITYEIEKTAQETKSLTEKKENELNNNIENKPINIEDTNEKNEENTNKKDNSKIKIELEVSNEYIPIKFLWTGDNEGYWIKTGKDDKEWYSIEEGIYPTFAYEPEATEMTFRINGNYNNYEVITEWDYKIYIWVPKLETEEYDKSLFLKNEQGILLQYDEGWENPFNETYNGRDKINMLPSKIKEKLINSYKIYIDNMQNQNIQYEEDEENNNEENEKDVENKNNENNNEEENQE